MIFLYLAFIGKIFNDFVSVTGCHIPSDPLGAGSASNYLVRLRRIYPRRAYRDFAYTWDSTTKIAEYKKEETEDEVNVLTDDLYENNMQKL